MSFKMRFAGFLTIMAGVSALSLKAQAQFGTGMYGGMQACPYPVAAASGASSVNDGVKDVQKEIDETKRAITSKKSEKKRLDRDVEKAERDITDTVESGYAEKVIEHMQNSRACEEYKPEKGSELGGPADDEVVRAPGVGGEEDGKPIARRGRNERSRPGVRTQPFKYREWMSVCMGPGKVTSEVCTEYRSSDARTSSSVCAAALKTYRSKYNEAQKAQSEIDNLSRALERLNDDLKDARQAAIDERKAQTEGGYCAECAARNSGYTYQQQQPNYLSLAMGVGMGLAGMYAGYQTNKTVAQYNSNLGFPTQASPSALSYGFPYFMGGLYGAIGGGMGSGGFGCGSGYGGTGFGNGPYGMMGPFGSGGLYGNMGMNSPFGYPGMSGMNGMGGGMYMPGMSPWGMNGMGMGMGMNPMMGMNGMGMNGMNPYGMGGMMSPFGMSPYGMGGLNGMMNPYGMGSNPFGLSGSLGMNPMMGMNGMNPYGLGGMNPYGLGGMGTYNPYSPFGMSGMNGMSSPYQSQLQQMQMQMYQSYMQQQQAQMQDAMNRQRAMSGLQSELYGLMNRIQQVQMGVGYGGGSSYLGTTGGYNSGTYSSSGSITGGISSGSYLGTSGVYPYTTTQPYATTPLTSGR